MRVKKVETGEWYMCYLMNMGLQRRCLGLTVSANPWYLSDVVWELERPVPCARGVAAKGALGVWAVSGEVRGKFVGALVRYWGSGRGRKNEGGFSVCPFVPIRPRNLDLYLSA